MLSSLFTAHNTFFKNKISTYIIDEKQSRLNWYRLLFSFLFYLLFKCRINLVHWIILSHRTRMSKSSHLAIRTQNYYKNNNNKNYIESKTMNQVCAAWMKNKNESNILHANSDRTHSHTYTLTHIVAAFYFIILNRTVYVCAYIHNNLILDLTQILSATSNLYRGFSEELASYFIFRSISFFFHSLVCCPIHSHSLSFTHSLLLFY